MDHRGHDGEVHEVRGVQHLPLGAHARVGQEVVGRGQLQEQDVHQERATRNLFRQRLGADDDGRDQVPDRHVGSHVDLLRRVTQTPPDHAVQLRIDFLIRPTDHQEGREQDAGTGQDREHGDDAGRQGAEGDHRDRAGVGLVLLGDHQGAHEHEAADQRADGEQDQAEVEVRRGLHRHVRREHHARLALEDGDVGHDRADDHQPELDPAPLRRGQAAAQQYRGGKVQNGHLEEDDPAQQISVDAVRGQDGVELVRRQQLEGRPAGHDDADGGDAANEQPENGHDGVPFHQFFGMRLKL